MNKPVCYSHIGKRPNHEDNFFMEGVYLSYDKQNMMTERKCCYLEKNSDAKVKLYAVSDGMGGHNAGEVASHICMEMLASSYIEIQNTKSLKKVIDILQEKVCEMNNTIIGLSEKKPELSGMGATLVILIIYGTEYAIMNIGDSRAYFYNHEMIIQITKDHTEGQRMLDLGILTRKELSGFPARKNLNRYIGYGRKGYTLEADVYYPVFNNGIVMLCSDGVSDFVPDSRILEFFKSEKTTKQIAKALVYEATESENADNATALLIPFRR